MVRFSKIWHWFAGVGIVILVIGIMIPFVQTNDTSVSEEANSPDNESEVAPTTKVESQQEAPVSVSPRVTIDPADKIELQQLFNDLRKEYLDARSESVNWWLQFIAIILTFFAVVIAIAGYIGFREFRRLRDEASQHVAAIRQDRVESNELMQNMRQRGNAEVFDMLSNNEEFEESLRDLLQDSELSVIDKAIADASALQQNGAIEDAIEKWRSIANMVEETDSDLAARSWFSVGYLHSQEGEPEKAIPAYNKAIYLRPDYAEAYNNRGASNGELGQYDAAITDLDKAIMLDPEDAEAYYNRGIVYFNRGNHDTAFTDFDKAIRLKPDHIGAHSNRGVSRARLGQYDAAISDLQTALDLAIQQGRTELKTDIEERLNELNNVE